MLETLPVLEKLMRRKRSDPKTFDPTLSLCAMWVQVPHGDGRVRPERHNGDMQEVFSKSDDSKSRSMSKSFGKSACSTHLN
jgi:hypothetical protein